VRQKLKVGVRVRISVKEVCFPGGKWPARAPAPTSHRHQNSSDFGFQISERCQLQRKRYTSCTRKYDRDAQPLGQKKVKVALGSPGANIHPLATAFSSWFLKKRCRRLPSRMIKPQAFFSTPVYFIHHHGLRYCRLRYMPRLGASIVSHPIRCVSG
jgi:hypothetical protein